MKASQEDTMQGKKQHKRFLGLAFGGLIYIEMLRIITELAMHVKELGNRPKEMKLIYHHN
jgi:hypothetical protein